MDAKELVDMDERWAALDTLQEGENGVVRTVMLEGTIARRLKELGLIAGTRVRCLQKSPSGDPVAYEIRGAVIALRQEDAAQVFIEPE